MSTTHFLDITGLSQVIDTVDARLALKVDSADLASVATSGSYTDLSDKPTIPTVPTLAAVATSGAYSDLTGTPTLASVATSGSYTDLTNLPSHIPTSGDAGTITAYEDTTVTTISETTAVSLQKTCASSLRYEITAAVTLTLAFVAGNATDFAVKTVYVKDTASVTTSLTIQGLTDWIGDTPSWSGLTGASLLFNVIFVGGEVYGQVLHYEGQYGIPNGGVGGAN